YSLEKFSEDNKKYSSYIKKMAMVGRDLTGADMHDVSSARTFIDRLEKIVKTIGVPKLSAFGIDSRAAVKIAESSESKNSPVKASAADFAMMIESMI
ncbi:MAG TPA: hypothetical protein PLJ39_09605, partial [Spirochaetota bacterium]|nr:hypothetical protein [Spirochaetota bacterium]